MCDDIGFAAYDVQGVAAALYERLIVVAADPAAPTSASEPLEALGTFRRSGLHLVRPEFRLATRASPARCAHRNALLKEKSHRKEPARLRRTRPTCPGEHLVPLRV